MSYPEDEPPMESITIMDGILGGVALLILGGGIFMLLGSMYDIGDKM